MRAGAGNVPTALNAEYYAQRANAGLIIAEGTAVSQQGQGYPNAPRIYTCEQVEGWRRVTQAIAERNGVASKSHFRLVAVYVETEEKLRLLYFQSTDIPLTSNIGTT